MRALDGQIERLRALRKKILVLVCIAAYGLCYTPNDAQAVSLGESVLTVAISTGAGAILGASTLPFYPVPGDHTGNIFYGAALGAVAGVFLAASMAVKEGPSDDDSFLDPSKKKNLDEPELRLAKTTRPENEFRKRMDITLQAQSPLVWAPVVSARF